MRRLAPVVALTVTVGALGAASVARASPVDVALKIDCPLLDEENRALLEARMRAELAPERLAGGEIAITCAAGSATVGWRPLRGATDLTPVRLAGDAASTVDALLEAFHTLLAAAPPSSPPAAPPSSPSSAPPDPTAVRSEDSVEVARMGREAARSAALLSGVDSELWGDGIAGAIGVHAGARVPLPSPWSLAAIGGPAWGVGSVDGLRAWRVRVATRLDYALASWLRVGAGVTGRVTWVDSTAGAPSSLTGWTAGGFVSARCVLPVGPIAIEVGPDLEALAPPLSAEVRGVEVFRWPGVLASLAIDVSPR